MTTKFDYGNLSDLAVYQWRFGQSLSKAGRIPTGHVQSKLLYVWLISRSGQDEITEFGDDISELFQQMLTDSENKTAQKVLAGGQGWDLRTYTSSTDQTPTFGMKGMNAMINSIELDYSLKTRESDGGTNEGQQAGSADDFLVMIEIETFGTIELGGSGMSQVKDDTIFA